MKAKIYSFLVSIIFFISISINTSLSSSFENQQVTIKIDGKSVVFNDQTGYPFIDENKRTQVPFRATLESFGAQVDWDQTIKIAIAVKNGIVVEVPIDSRYIYKNGIEIPNDTKAVIKNGRTYLPIRVVLEAFGSKVGWQAETKTVLIEGQEKKPQLEDWMNVFDKGTVIKEYLDPNLLTVDESFDWSLEASKKHLSDVLDILTKNKLIIKDEKFAFINDPYSISMEVKNIGNDLYIYGGIIGAIKGITVNKPDGLLYEEYAFILPDTPIIIKNAEAGLWKVEFTPYVFPGQVNSYQTVGQLRVALLPSDLEVELPVYNNQPVINLADELMGDRLYEIEVKHSVDNSSDVIQSKALSIPLKEGKNTAFIAISEGGYKSLTTSYSVFYDSKNPEINLTSSATNLNTLPIVTENEFFGLGVNSNESVMGYINGVLCPGKAYDDGTCRFGNNIKLKAGKNIITVEAFDQSGNYIKKTIEVMWEK